MRGKFAEIPLGLHHPLWIEDPDFDLDYHLRHIAVPPPGGERQLGGGVGATVHQELQHGGARRVAHQGGDFGEGVDGDHAGNLGPRGPIRHGQ